MQSTADFLAANRCARRYLITIAESVAAMGAVSVIGVWQMTYKSGFAYSWWELASMPILMCLALLGWVAYRYRETRVMTMAQFFELRYSRGLRIFAGIICWLSGILNFGIFPAVGATFFMQYCGLPESWSIAGLAGIAIPTYPSLLIILISVAVYFTFVGGQIAVLVTDFTQAFFTNMVLMAILILLMAKYSFVDIFDGLLVAEPGKSLVNPFDAGDTPFNPWYFIIAIVGAIFNRLSWQGSQAYHCSAKNPHEAKLAWVLGRYREWGFRYALIIIPLVAYMFMHHPAYTEQADQVNQLLSGIENPEIRDQMLVPTTMTLYMPVGLAGAFAAAMFALFISTHDTYLHSWGTIFVQDILIPLRGKPLSNKQHILTLRLSVLFVAVFIFCWSMFFRQTQNIFLYFAITGAIWLGGAGIVIIGGLYTRWGTTAGAYASLITGSILATTGLILEQLWTVWYGKNFFLTGQEIYFLAMMAAIVIYVTVSLLGKRSNFNLEKVLHRGKYKVDSDRVRDEAAPTSYSPKKWNWKKALGITKDFTRGDKIIYGISIVYALAMLLIFICLTTAAILLDLSARFWAAYFRYYLILMIITSFGIALWLSIGGIHNLLQMFKDLKAAKRDFTDDGWISNSDDHATNDINPDFPDKQLLDN